MLLAIKVNYFWYSDSFDLRAPKRKIGIKKVKQLQPPLSSPRYTISNRPPAALPKDTETSVENNYDDYATVQLDSFHSVSDELISVEYDYVHRKPNTFPREKHVVTPLTQGINLIIATFI